MVMGTLGVPRKKFYPVHGFTTAPHGTYVGQSTLERVRIYEMERVKSSGNSYSLSYICG